MGTRCTLCPKQSVDGGIVCQPCADTCRTELLHVARELAQELDDALSGTTTGTTGIRSSRSSRSAEPPLPISTAVTEARAHLHSILAGWAATVYDDIGGLPPAPELVPLASYLARQVDVLRHADYGPDAVRELRAAYRRAMRAIDLPIRRIRLPRNCPVTVLDPATGRPRPCGGTLYGIIAPGLPDDGEIRCACDPTHATTPAEWCRRERVAARLRTRLGTRSNLP